MAEKQSTFAFAQVKTDVPEAEISKPDKSGAANPNWRGGPVTLACQFCGEDFKVRPARRDRAKYCSLSCWSRASHAANPRTGRKHPKRNSQPDVEIHCQWCDGSYMVPFHRRRFKKFCGKPCEFAWRKSWMDGRGNPNWKEGSSRIPYPFDWPKISRRIRKRDGRVCRNPECLGPVGTLVVHHIDYHKSNCDPANLVTVCTQCNSRANYDRERWMAVYREVQESRGIFPLQPGSPLPYVLERPGREGSKHPMAKLVEDDIRAISRMSRAGMKNRRIAEHFQIGEASVSNILKGKSWSHVV